LSLPPGWRRDWRQVGGVRTHALVAGSGLPVVLVPGLGTSHLTFRRLQESLSLTNTVFAYDPPGYGFSLGRRDEYTTMSDMAAHLADWLEDAGLRGATLLGHSQGAEIAVAVSTSDPAACGSLILVAPTGIPDYPNLAVQMGNLFRDLPQERIGFTLPLGASYLRAGPRRLLAHWTDQLRHDTASRLSKVTVPTQVIYGTRDPVVRPGLAHAVAAAIPQARLSAIDGAGHGLQDHRAEQVAALVSEFLGSGSGLPH
jgi:pimeloyl-ACP methyl ester carboxylesterase